MTMPRPIRWCGLQLQHAVTALADAVRELRVIALFAGIWIAVRLTLWVTSADPVALGGTAVAAIWGSAAALVAGVAALAQRTPNPPKDNADHE